MPRVLGFMILLGVGFALGYGFGKSQEAPLSTLSLENAKTKFASLSERELEDYHQLKSLRGRYEKADEILGKMVLILLADVGVRFSQRVEMASRDAAQGRHTGLPQPKNHVVPTDLPVPQSDLAQTSEVPRDQPSPVQSSQPPSIRRTTQTTGAVAFNRPEVRSRKSCESGKMGWFLTGENPGAYTFGLDGQGDRVGEPIAWIQGKQENNNPESAEFIHCAQPPFKPGQVYRLTAWVKAAGIRDYANLNIRSGRSHREMTIVARKSIRDTFDWKLMTVETEAHAETQIMSFGLRIQSTGQIWIKDVTFGPVP
jgi:hypothetical protein